MSDDKTPSEECAPKKKDLTPEAQRALEEADARRQARDAEENGQAEPEKGGPRGEEPTRYGDWERKGIAYDF